jgi:hypothetical protein
MLSSFRQGDSIFATSGLIGGVGNCEMVWFVARKAIAAVHKDVPRSIGNLHYNIVISVK